MRKEVLILLVTEKREEQITAVLFFKSEKRKTFDKRGTASYGCLVDEYERQMDDKMGHG